MKQPGAGKEVHRGKVTSSKPDNSTLLRPLTFVIHAKMFYPILETFVFFVSSLSSSKTVTISPRSLDLENI